MLFELWVFCKGTMSNCEMFELDWRAEPNSCVSLVASQSTGTNTPMLDHETPSQNITKDDDPSLVLSTHSVNIWNTMAYFAYRPAAKILDELPLLTSTAVTGPGTVAGSPTALQVLLAKLYCATFAEVPSARVMMPAAMRTSWLL